ncbi:MAG: thioredoxin domain-containing protein [Christensenellales bacterium]
MSNNQYTNKLIRETSPYLLQHAHNPVDWYPWSSEAFEKAKQEDKPIFLSIGYSTCHWCHVMAHESFEDADVAAILNAGFVSVKVDREERPDIDEVYMNVCQAMTGSGGWPLTIIMTAEKKPFFAGTYLPKETIYGRIGMTELLARIITLWQKNRAELIKHSYDILELFNDNRGRPQGQAADAQKIIDKAYGHIENSYEEAYGGFSGSPKFPTPHYLLYLLRYWKAYHKEKALDMTEKTLEHMYRGGIFDHIGYGFSRYSTDSKWLVPHFEKMLYDNAMLISAYTECFAATGRPFYGDIAQKICAYILRDMKSPEGGFFSAEDADSENVEGKYYVWDYNELKELCSENELCLLEARYGVTKRGNFEGKNILNLLNAHAGGGELESAVIQKLFKARQKKIRPFKDTKVLASWNGLMIEALARAGTVFSNDNYIISAIEAADFILINMIDENSGLSGVYKDGMRSSKSFLADYANMANGLISLYTATRDIKYLKNAVTMAQDMIKFFWDEQANRFFMVRKGKEELFVRPRDEYDGAMPSGNSCAVACLLRLYNLLGEEFYRQMLESATQGFLSIAAEAPGAHVHFISSLLVSVVPHSQVVIAARKDDLEAVDTYKTIIKDFLPFTTVIYYDKSDEMDMVFPELTQYKTDKPFAGFVCENYACRKPVYSREDLLLELRLRIKEPLS